MGGGGGGIHNSNNIDNKKEEKKKVSAVPPSTAVVALGTVQGGEGDGDVTLPTAMAAMIGAAMSNDGTAQAANANKVPSYG